MQANKSAVRRSRSLPAGLVLLQEQFATWRAVRKRGARIPQALWSGATAHAKTFGVSRTAKALNLDSGMLRTRAGLTSTTRSVPDRSGSEAFVEFKASIGSPPPECVIEVDHPCGSRMRIQLKGASCDDVGTVAAKLWLASS